MKDVKRIPHTIFNYNLSMNALKVYIYLTTCQNIFGTASVRISVIARNCAISSQTTVKAVLAELQAKGLVHAFRRRSHDGDYIANGYDIRQLSGKYFVFPTDKATFALPKASYATLLFMHKCVDKSKGSKRRIWPSLSIISSALHIAKNTILSAISDLVQRCLIWKAGRWAGKKNMYVVHAAHTAQEEANKKSSMTTTSHCPRTSENQTSTNFLDTIVAGIKKIVKKFSKTFRLFGLSGSKIGYQYIEPAIATKKEE